MVAPAASRVTLKLANLAASFSEYSSKFSTPVISSVLSLCGSLGTNILAPTMIEVILAGICQSQNFPGNFAEIVRKSRGKFCHLDNGGPFGKIR